MTDAELTCPRCEVVVNEKTDDHVWDELEDGSRNFYVYHIECLDNDEKPEQYRECEACHKTGVDSTGSYPSFYRGYAVEHGACVDWDDVRKTRATMAED